LENLEGRVHLEDVGIHGRIMDFKETGKEDVDWIHLSQDRVH
jgi:hypothetical protein